jgi:tetratricopeptide (TPR) repeat protein
MAHERDPQSKIASKLDAKAYGMGDVRQLDPLSEHKVDAAEGYHMIGMYQAALDEIDSLPLSEQEHPIALHIKCRALFGLRLIPEALEATEAFIGIQPNHPGGYILKAQLLTLVVKHREAYDLLKLTFSRFPGHRSIPYDLALAAAHLQLWPEARHWIYLAITRFEWNKQLALATDVLAPIYDYIETIHASS